MTTDTPDLPERCCGRCCEIYISDIGPMPWCNKFAKYVEERDGESCPAFTLRQEWSEE